MYKLALFAAVICLLATGGCALPNHAEQVAHNETKLSAEGIAALNIGDPAPSLSLEGTGGISLIIGAVPQVPDSITAAPATPVQQPAADSQLPAAGAEQPAAATPDTAGTTPAAAEAAAGEASPEPQGDAALAAESPASPVSQPAAGKTWIALYFFPAPETPNSTQQLIRYSQQYAALSADGLSLYGICVSDLAGLQKYADRIACSVPLLADTDGAVCRAYGCLPTPGRFSQRTTVLISPDGKVMLYARGMATADALRKAAGLSAAVKPAPAEEK